MDAEEALKLYEEADSYWFDIYEAFRSDVRFSIGLDHWSDEDIRLRGEANCLIVPVLPQYIHQVVNDMRQNTPSINVIPANEGAAVETAKVLKGLIRNIEYRSNADEVYDTGGEYAVRGGFGFARVDHDYISEDSFLQELLLRRVQNPESIYLDPSYTSCDGSDAEWGIILDTITKTQFEEKYPDKAYSSFNSLDTDIEADHITIAEVFKKTYEDVDMEMAQDGSMVAYTPDPDEEKDKKKKKRKLRKVVIKRYKFSGTETLEETTFPGKFIPIVPFLGEEVWIDGRRHLLSLIRNAKDAQRRVNKWATKESELLDMAPIAPILAPVGSIENLKEDWQRVDDTIVLRYQMYDSQGNKLDKPERLAPPTIPTGIINAMAGAKESVKEALGMYNASVGQRSNETSGVAIDARKLEGEVATFHFADNRNRSIQHIGRILINAIPEIYDTDRVIQIIGDEEEAQLVGVNGGPFQMGQEVDHDLRKGLYDVRVVTGASYTTKRQEGAALMGDALKANPALMGVIGDLYFKNLDVAGADAIAARVRKTIPKELIADEEAKQNGEKAPDPEKMQMAQIIEQLQAQMQEMGAELQSKQSEEMGKKADIQLKVQELDLKRADQQIKAQTEATKADLDRMKLELEARKLDLEAQKLQVDTMIAMKDTPEPEEEITKTPEEEESEAIEEEMLQQQEAQRQQELHAQEMLKIEQTQAVVTALSSISQQLSNLTNQVSQPITVVRDENGAIVGAV